MIKGNTPSIVKTKDLGIWGVAICKDVDFANPLRQYSNQGINILFSPALNMGIDGWIHGRVAVMQGVAGNFSVARTAQYGILSFSDNRGRILVSATTKDN